jgi:hypothetical protein
MDLIHVVEDPSIRTIDHIAILPHQLYDYNSRINNFMLKLKIPHGVDSSSCDPACH